ncbi:MAG: gliding motility-associated protein GldE [Chitinophagaceae bacterium]|nr:gliding motility-associated protein GldE [Chitinophagaceae bacterium]
MAISELLMVPLVLIQSFPVEVSLFSFSTLLLLFISFLISGGEHALFSLTSSELADLEKKSPRTFRHIQHLMARPRHLLVLVKMLQMVINVTVLFIAVKIGIHLFGGSSFSWLEYLLEILALIFLLLVCQEILPKFFGGKNNIMWSKTMGTPLLLLSRLLFPFTEFIIESSYFIEKRFARENEGLEEEVMEKPEEQLVEESTGHDDGIPILQGILKFRTIVVRQIMKSRIDMVCVDEKTAFEQLLKTVRDVGYSRIPVYRESLDHIIGILYTKDLLTFLQEPANQNWHQLIREPYFVPEGKKISELLVELQSNQRHLVMVIDEYGRTAGLVTLEDIVEEIIGDIRDETDEKIELDFTKVDENNFIFEAKTPINDFCKLMNLPEDFFDEVKSDTDSLGGLILEIRGTIPQPNETVEYENFLFTVLSVENYRINKVKVTRMESKSEESS